MLLAHRTIGAFAVADLTPIRNTIGETSLHVMSTVIKIEIHQSKVISTLENPLRYCAAPGNIPVLLVFPDSIKLTELKRALVNKVQTLFAGLLTSTSGQKGTFPMRSAPHAIYVCALSSFMTSCRLFRIPVPTCAPAGSVQIRNEAFYLPLFI